LNCWTVYTWTELACMGKTLASEKDPDRRQPPGGFTTRPSRDTHPLADTLTASPVCSCACTCVWTTTGPPAASSVWTAIGASATACCPARNARSVAVNDGETARRAPITRCGSCVTFHPSEPCCLSSVALRVRRPCLPSCVWCVEGTARARRSNG